jgi:hypothetical protein
MSDGDVEGDKDEQDEEDVVLDYRLGGIICPQQGRDEDDKRRIKHVPLAGLPLPVVLVVVTQQ